MKTRLFTILALVVLALSSCATKEDVAGVQERIDALKSSKIATVQEQAAAITATIETLKKADTDLNAYIAEVRNAADALSNDQKAQLDALSSLIEELEQSEDDLAKKIAELEDYAAKGIADAKDWMEATFATLARLDELTQKVAALEGRVADCEEALDALELKLTEAYTKAIKDAVAATKTSMESWVCDQLKGYYTIAQADAKLSKLEKGLTDADADIKKQIEEQKTALETAKSDLETAYKAAIETAITEFEGSFNTKIATAIATAQDALEGQCEDIDTALSSIEERISDIEERIETILGQIQSVVIVPYYEDGSVPVNEIGISTFTFDVRPAAAIKALVELADLSVFSFKVVETKSAAPALEIEKAEINDKGQLVLTVGTEEFSDSFFAGEETFSACLSISAEESGSDLCSDYFTLCALRLTLYDYVREDVTVEQL